MKKILAITKNNLRVSGLRVLMLFAYILSIFGSIDQKHPVIHDLFQVFLTILAMNIILAFITYLIRIWTVVPNAEAKPEFPWKQFVLAIYIYNGVIVFLVLLMYLTHYPL